MSFGEYTTDYQGALTLNYEAELADGSPLPAGIEFNPTTRTITVDSSTISTTEQDY